MSPTCKTCGESWDEDPALLVPCPVCEADEGEPCTRVGIRPLGAGSDWQDSVHPERDRQAVEDVEGYGPCDHATHDKTSGHGQMQRTLGEL